VSLLIQSGYKPKREWIENHFKVDLANEEDFQAAAPQSDQVQDAPESYDPEADGDLYDKIFGSEDGEKPFGDEKITEDEAVSESSDDDDLYGEIFGDDKDEE
jgi:hypothetical protein